ncbi:phage terminase small subunit [Candidatus Enterococcus ikei]|uniref:TerS n=1 Tax=Candidatus Enterococcus ikei TaxID=2815326 RepID=A0ABS3GUM0_9ENTE|nr:phage terminase small subunit [Enterococcus sp. DIV0869a]MBO0438957.1 TerS [Enterococcus sp. DIV0869a]
MARARNPNRDKAREIWIASNGTKKLKDIAEELGCSDSQIRKWKSQDNWESEIKSNAPNDNSNVTNEKERYQSAKGNNNAKGNKGGSAPPNNKNAVSHGLFAKWLPDDTKELIQEIYTSEPADIIWNNIMIQYTAIIRSQRIMFVQDELDTTSNVTEVVVEPTLVDTQTNMPVKRSEKREYQYAWDKQANFLSAQSRAMGTLSNLIKQFISLADERDERRLKLETMQAQLDKLSGPKEGAASKDWKQAVIDAANKRAVDTDE